MKRTKRAVFIAVLYLTAAVFVFSALSYNKFRAENEYRKYIENAEMKAFCRVCDDARSLSDSLKGACNASTSGERVTMCMAAEYGARDLITGFDALCDDGLVIAHSRRFAASCMEFCRYLNAMYYYCPKLKDADGEKLEAYASTAQAYSLELTRLRGEAEAGISVADIFSRENYLSAASDNTVASYY